MNRRTLLKTGGMAAIGLGFGACAGKSPQTAPVTTQGVRALARRTISCR